MAGFLEGMVSVFEDAPVRNAAPRRELVYNAASCAHCGSQAPCRCRAPVETPLNNAYQSRYGAASADAASKTMQSGLTSAGRHGIAAGLEATNDNDSESASKAHLKAARAHESEADRLQRDGYHDRAHEHWTAASAHRAAASEHKATLPSGGDRDNRHGREIDEGANSTLVSGPVPAGQGRGDVLAANKASLDGWTDEATWRRNIEAGIAAEIRERSRGIVHVPESAATRRQLAANAQLALNAVSTGPREFFQSTPSLYTTENVSSDMARRLGITLNAPGERDLGKSEITRGLPSFDDRQPTRRMARSGQVVDDAEDVDSLHEHVSIGQDIGDRDAENAARAGFAAYDSSQSAEVNLARQRRMREMLAANEARHAAQFVPVGQDRTNQSGRHIRNSDDIHLHGEMILNVTDPEDSSVPGVSGAMVAFFQKNGIVMTGA